MNKRSKVCLDSDPTGSPLTLLTIIIFSRDLIIALGKYPLHLQDAPTIPLSDGAGIITQVGSKVTEWKKDDRVMSIFNQTHLKGPSADKREIQSGLGGGLDGMLSQWRVVSRVCRRESPGEKSLPE